MLHHVFFLFLDFFAQENQIFLFWIGCFKFSTSGKCWLFIGWWIFFSRQFSALWLVPQNFDAMHVRRDGKSPRFLVTCLGTWCVYGLEISIFTFFDWKEKYVLETLCIVFFMLSSYLSRYLVQVTSWQVLVYCRVLKSAKFLNTSEKWTTSL